MPGRQLTIRLDAADRDKLEALAYVRRKPSAALAREIVVEYIASHQDERGVQAALASRAEHDEADETEAATKVTKLRSRK
jgi:predicted transcriptional regulator